MPDTITDADAFVPKTAAASAPALPGSLTELWREWTALKDQQFDLDRLRATAAAGMQKFPCIQIGIRLVFSEAEIVRFVDPSKRAASLEALRVETQKHIAEEESRGITVLDTALEEIDGRIDVLHKIAQTLPATSAGDLAVLLDLMLDYDVEIGSSFYEDRLDLEHLVAELRRMAPEFEISTMRRLIAAGAIEAAPTESTEQDHPPAAAPGSAREPAGFV